MAENAQRNRGIAGFHQFAGHQESLAVRIIPPRVPHDALQFDAVPIGLHRVDGIAWVQHELLAGSRGRDLDLLAKPNHAAARQASGAKVGRDRDRLPGRRVETRLGPAGLQSLVARIGGAIFLLPGEHLGEEFGVILVAPQHVVDLLLGHVVQLGVGEQGLAADPGFGRRSFPRAMNDRHRHVQLIVQTFGKEVAHRREFFADVSRRADGPSHGHVILGCERRRGPDIRRPNLRLIGRGRFGRIERRMKAHRHVRLSGSQPDLADQHILDRDRAILAAIIISASARAGLERIERDSPSAAGIGAASISI